MFDRVVKHAFVKVAGHRGWYVSVPEYEKEKFKPKQIVEKMEAPLLSVDLHNRFIYSSEENEAIYKAMQRSKGVQKDYANYLAESVIEEGRLASFLHKTGMMEKNAFWEMPIAVPHSNEFRTEHDNINGEIANMYTVSVEALKSDRPNNERIDKLKEVFNKVSKDALISFGSGVSRTRDSGLGADIIIKNSVEAKIDAFRIDRHFYIRKKFVV